MLSFDFQKWEGAFPCLRLVQMIWKLQAIHTEKWSQCINSMNLLPLTELMIVEMPNLAVDD